MTRYAVLLSVAWLALVAGYSSSEVEDGEAGANQTILAAWRAKSGDATLIYRDGRMVWELRHDSGGVLTRDLIERPADRPGERKFDLDDHVRSEYVTLSEAGTVKYFSWEGQNFHTATADSMHPEAMTIGSNVQARECVPTQLSDSATKVVRLYEQLHGFKNDPEFAEMGFSAGGPYHAWLDDIQSLDGGLDSETRIEAFSQLGVFVGEITMLGMNYMSVATAAQRGSPPSPETRQHIEDVDRTLQAALAQAFCR